MDNDVHDEWFRKGYCVCGNVLWQAGHHSKYSVGIIVKKGKDTSCWQWYCRQCGRIHHEIVEVLEHKRDV